MSKQRSVSLSRAEGPTACASRHVPMTTSPRRTAQGERVHFSECSTCQPPRYAMGVESSGHTLITWYQLTRARFTRVIATDPITPVPTLLCLAGYVGPKELLALL
jgi:hypothetical protein